MTIAPARAAVQGLRKVGSQFIVMQPPSDAYLPRDQHGWYNHCMVAPATKSMDRLLTTLADCLTRESAERVVNLRMDAETRAWVEDLASKANEGLLSESERSEYIAYIEVMDWI